VARLRDHNTAATDILLHTHLEAGHSGTSGRMRRLRDVALGYAFLLDLAGITD
jgi:oligopeptidase B